MGNENQKTILLVEDEAIIAMSEKMSLEKYQYGVFTVNSGKKAVEFFKETNNVDLILMDIDLGKGIDGTEAAEIILRDHEIPIVFLSSHTSLDVVEKTEKITSYGYVVKNSGITVLDASIKMAFKLFEANNELKNELKERKQIEAALMESKEKFSMTFKTSPYAITITRPVDGLFIEVNDSFHEMMGFTREELANNTSVGMRLWVNVEDRNSVVKILLNGGKVSRKEFEFKKKNGEIMTGLFSAHLIHVSNDTFILSSIDDITERKKVEKALRENEEKYREIIAQSIDGISITDISGTVATWNTSMESITGILKRDAIGVPVWEIQGKLIPKDQATPELLEQLRNVLENILLGKTDWPGETREQIIICADGNRKKIQDSSFIIKTTDTRRFGTIIRDITEHKQSF